MIALNEYSKSHNYINPQFDTWIYVNAPMFIVRTDDNFTRYTHRKSVKIDKGVSFDIYNVLNEPIAVKIIKDTFDSLQSLPDYFSGIDGANEDVIFTHFRGTSNERQIIFTKFKEYYQSIGYRVLTTDTDHNRFNRSAARNTAAMVCPTQVLVILDADVFIPKEVLEESIETSKKSNGVIKPSHCMVEYRSDYEYKDFDVNQRLLEVKQKEAFSKEEIERKYTTGECFFENLTEEPDPTKYLGIINYQGYAFIQRTVFWLGMDETFEEYGNEDSAYLGCVEKVLNFPVTYQSYTPSFAIPHKYYGDKWSETSFHKFISMYEKLNVEQTLEELKKNAYYGHYGKFTHL